MATFTVTTTADEAFGGGTVAAETADGTGLSLREAIALANANDGEDMVAFDPSLTAAVLRLTGGELSVTDDVILDGTSAGTSGVILSGDANGDDRDAAGAIGAAGTGITDLDNSAGYLADNSRILNTNSSGIELIGLTLTGGVAFGSYGGAIYNGSGRTTLTDIAIIGNSSGYVGGGVATNSGDITLTNSTLSGNQSGYGGGALFADSGSTLTIVNSTVEGNSSGSDGGGIYNRGTLDLVNSTIVGNTSFEDGGGIFNGGTLDLVNNTIVGNIAGFYGGGIFNVGTLDLVNSTVTGNYAGLYGGGIDTTFGPITITNSLVTGNASGRTDNDVAALTATYTGGNIIGGTLTDASGSFVSGGITADLIFDQTVNVNGTGIFGGVAADNGGPVQTVALLSDAANPAVDGSNDALALDGNGTPLTTDARGLDRAVDQDPPGSDAIDLGAFELQPGTPPLPILLGTDGDDTLIATNEDEIILSLRGGDSVEGRGGDDFITGNRDGDFILGQNGDDTIKGGTGADTIEGGNGADRISGDDESDVILGGNGNDTIFGGAADDVLSGGDHNDKLLGGAGNDTLNDGDGRDTLTGGIGADVFELATDTRNDIIRDFEDGADLIQLSGVAFADLTIVDAGGGEVRISYATDMLILEEGGGPLAAADFDASDFLFV